MLAIVVIPLWAFAPSVPLLVVGAFVMQFMVQGAWGVIPAHINELAPDSVRGFLPGFAYQCGVLRRRDRWRTSRRCSPMRISYAQRHGAHRGHGVQPWRDRGVGRPRAARCVVSRGLIANFRKFEFRVKARSTAARNHRRPEPFQ